MNPYTTFDYQTLSIICLIITPTHIVPPFVIIIFEHLYHCFYDLFIFTIYLFIFHLYLIMVLIEFYVLYLFIFYCILCIHMDILSMK